MECPFRLRATKERASPQTWHRSSGRGDHWTWDQKDEPKRCRAAYGKARRGRFWRYLYVEREKSKKGALRVPYQRASDIHVSIVVAGVLCVSYSRIGKIRCDSDAELVYFQLWY